MAQSIACRVVSPERPLFEGDVERLVAPGSMGELGIYPMHAPLIAKLMPGVLRLHHSGSVEKMAVRGGFVEVKNDEVMLLVTRAVRPEDVDAKTLQARLDETIQDLRSPSNEARYEELLETRQWLEVCLKMHA